jgi:hypothetical protein
VNRERGVAENKYALKIQEDNVRETVVRYEYKGQAMKGEMQDILYHFTTRQGLDGMRHRKSNHTQSRKSLEGRLVGLAKVNCSVSGFEEPGIS